MNTSTDMPTTARTILDAGPSSVREHVGSEEALGRLALLEFTAAPGYPVPPAHVHEREDEVTYVLSGTLRVQVGEDERIVVAGDSILKPSGVVHSFEVVGDEPARFLEFITPGGFDRYFHQVAAAMEAGTFSPPVAAELMANHCVRPIPD